MTKKIYSIAGLKVELSGESSMRHLSKLPEFNIFETNIQSETNIDIFIRMDKNVNVANLAEICLIHHYSIFDTDHSFSRYQEGYVYEMCRKNENKVLRILYNTCKNEVSISPYNCSISMKFALWIAYCLGAIKKDVFPIHASTIVKDSEAVLFLGESGTGKSTHTRLWLQHIQNTHLLNDDSPLLCIKNEKVFVCGSPWSGKTRCYRQETAPLKAIVRLSQYPENKIALLNNLTSIGAIHPSFPPFLAYDKLFSEKMIYMIDRIIKDTPVYEMKCRPDRQAAEIAYAKIY